MADPFATLGSGLAAAFATVVIAWLFSLVMRDASVVDRFWGLLFVVQGGVYLSFAPVWDVHRLVLLALVVAWGMRLTIHIHLRNSGEGEDARYRRMRERHPENFWWRSLFTVFALQAVIAFIVALPLWAVLTCETAIDAWAIAMAATTLWLIGFIFEAGGDWQLARFKKDPGNQGAVLDRGLWSMTRHPNYFGDALVWWAYFGFALAVPGGLWTFPGPLLMTLLLRYFSGVNLLERDLSDRKPDYARYVRETPPFFPTGLFTMWPGVSDNLDRRKRLAAAEDEEARRP